MLLSAVIGKLSLLQINSGNRNISTYNNRSTLTIYSTNDKPRFFYPHEVISLM